MQLAVTRATYLHALRESLREICFDLAGGERFDFEALFCPLRIDRGQYAFQSHQEGMALPRGIWEGRPEQPEDLPAFGGELPPGTLMDPRHPSVSHILAVAGAGHGKSMLLRRIALYYCHPEDETPAQQAVRKTYGLTGHYMPCILRLRDLGDGPISLDAAIAESLLAVFRTWADREGAEVPTAAAVRPLLAWPRDLLLLVDGLDELSHSRRLDFLRALETYLREYAAPVIMTSRAAGLSEPDVCQALGQMGFVGRSILPLTDEEALTYAQKWIEVTQPQEKRPALRDAVAQIQQQSRLQYLRPFLRTPLELLCVLRQLAEDALSPDRFHLFRDLLWRLFTGHVKDYAQKQPAFNDTMTLLGFLAFQMQLRDALFLSRRDLKALAPRLRQLSFYTAMTGDGSPAAFRSLLDDLAASVGVVERDDRAAEERYAFPVRTYQEFLTAYACCHRQLDPCAAGPDPIRTLRPHLDDSRWDDVVNFALADLNAHDEGAFHALMDLVLHSLQDLPRLQALVEADLNLTPGQARLLCRQAFRQPWLSQGQQALLAVCMTTQSACVYARVLLRAYRDNAPSGDYLEAAAIAAVLRAYAAGRSAQEQALAYLEDGTAAGGRLGAVMVDLLAKAWLEEGLPDYRQAAKADLTVTPALLGALHASALAHQDPWAVKTLTDLWLTRIRNSGQVAPLLTPDLAQILRGELDRQAPLAQQLCLGDRDAVRRQGLRVLAELLVTLGTFPAGGENAALMDHGPGDPFVAAIFQTLCANSCSLGYPRAALAIAGLYYCWDRPQFTAAWGREICGGRLETFLRQNASSLREQNHFHLLRDSFRDFEEAYRAQQPPAAHPSEAAGPTASRPRGLAEFLAEAVEAHFPYALVHLALHELEQGRYAQGKALLTQLTPEDWQTVAERHGLQEEGKQAPLDALADVLACLSPEDWPPGESQTPPPNRPEAPAPTPDQESAPTPPSAPELGLDQDPGPIPEPNSDQNPTMTPNQNSAPDPILEPNSDQAPAPSPEPNWDQNSAPDPLPDPAPDLSPEDALAGVLATHYGGCRLREYDAMLAKVRRAYPHLPDDVLGLS